MLSCLLEKMECDIEWRLKRNKLIRFVVFALLLFSFTAVFTAEWQEIKPIRGMYNNYISVQGTAPQKEVREIENKLKNIPQWIIESHSENGGKLFLKTNEFPKSDFTEYGESHRVLGTYNCKTKHIIILNDKTTMESTLYHEYGHYIDSIFMITEEQEFTDIFTEEKEKYFAKVEKSKYHISCKDEYFAGAFSQYIINEKKLKKYCPMTYNIIKKYVERGTENEHRQIESKA